jgi:ribosomal-protein-alanine N-acetyltransferase
VTDPVDVRLFEPGDLPVVLRMERESFENDAWPRELFLEYAAIAPDLFLIAHVEGHAAGYSIALLTRHGAEIESLGVRPRYRGRGVATRLVRASLKKVRRRGARVVWLMVRRENAAAVALYRKLGFERTATVPDYYEDGGTAWRMRLRFS